MLPGHLILAVAGFIQLVTGQNATSSSSSTYTNPVLDTVGADPWVIRYDNFYYMTFTLNDNLTLYRSQDLTNWNNAETKLLFKPPKGMNYSTDMWAPEIHNIDDKWYVIFTADPAGDSPPPETDMFCEYSCPAVNHRMFVLESSGSDPWTSNYTLKSQLNTYDQFAIDGTYFRHSTVSNPYTITSNFTDRQILSVPSNPWEKTPYGRPFNDRLSTNEGPQQLTNPTTGQTFIIYSGGRSDNRNYCLGQLELVGDNPMNVQDWRKNDAGCVFYQNPANRTYGVGHASFTTSPDGTEDWIVYHGMLDPANGWGARTIRAQRFGWNADGSPRFPRPGYGPFERPSGGI